MSQPTPARPDTRTFDLAIAYMLDILEPGDMAHEVERLLRMGLSGAIRPLVALGKLGVPRTVRRHLTEAGLPGAETLTQWGRILGAMSTWDPTPDPDDARIAMVPLHEAGWALGYADGPQLSNHIRRRAGVCAQEWRARGGEITALCDLLAECWVEKKRGVA